MDADSDIPGLRRVALVWATVAVALGCGNASEQGVAEATERWSAIEDLRIGSLNDPDQSLTSIGTVAVAPDGNLYVAQPDENLVRVFNDAGDLVRTIGRRGEGPGEFVAIVSLGILTDTLYVTDAGLNRVSFFSLEGEFLEAIALASPAIGSAIYATVPYLLLPDGTAVVKPMWNFVMMKDQVTHVPLLRIDRSGGIVDTLVLQPTTNTIIAITDFMIFSLQPFHDEPYAVVAEDGSRIAVIERAAAKAPGPAQYRVNVTNLDLDTIYARSYEYEPIPMPPGMADRAVADRMRRAARAGNEKEAEAAVRSALYLPGYLPPVTGAWFASDGTLWIRRERQEGVPQTLEIHDPDGVPKARVQLPVDVAVTWVGPEAVWATKTDSLDVPYLVRYRVRQSGG